MQHLKEYFSKERQWRRRGNRAETEMGTELSAKKKRVEEWLKKLRMQTAGWTNKNDPHCLTVRCWWAPTYCQVLV